MFTKKIKNSSKNQAFSSLACDEAFGCGFDALLAMRVNLIYAVSMRREVNVF